MAVVLLIGAIIINSREEFGSYETKTAIYRCWYHRRVGARNTSFLCSRDLPWGVGTQRNRLALQ